MRSLARIFVVFAFLPLAATTSHADSVRNQIAKKVRHRLMKSPVHRGVAWSVLVFQDGGWHAMAKNAVPGKPSAASGWFDLDADAAKLHGWDKPSSR